MKYWGMVAKQEEKNQIIPLRNLTRGERILLIPVCSINLAASYYQTKTQNPSILEEWVFIICNVVARKIITFLFLK